MNHRCLPVLLCVMAVMFLAPAGVAGQTLTAAAENWTPSRTPWGDPDLQGSWTNTTQLRCNGLTTLGNKIF